MKKSSRNLFRLTRFILVKFPAAFKFLAWPCKPAKRLLIIKTDAIGDYILFRNFIEIVRRSEKFQGYQIDLLGNISWQEIALHYDRQYISSFFFIDPDSLYQAPIKTLKLGWKLFKRRYQLVLQPTFARTFITDGLAGLAAAKQVIGFQGNTERISIKHKTKTDKYYTQLFVLPADKVFELERHRFFFQNVLHSPIATKGPFIGELNENKSGIIIFPGAAVPDRRWDIANFRELIALILAHCQQPVYLAGGSGELEIGKYLIENLPSNQVNNLIGKTTLPQLIELIGNSALVIANETSAIHIAAATQTKSVCILGGGHFGRFAPYPEYMTSKPLCIFERMECYHCNWTCKFQQAGTAAFPCIANVSVPQVWQLVMPLLLKA